MIVTVMKFLSLRTKMIQIQMILSWKRNNWKKWHKLEMQTKK